MSVTGYSTQSSARTNMRAESFLQSLVPYPVSPLGPQDPVDVRIPGNGTVDIPMMLSGVGTYRQVVARFMLKNEYAGPLLTGSLSWNAAAIGGIMYTGVGTAFTSELRAGDVVYYTAGLVTPVAVEVTVAEVVSDTQFKGQQTVSAATTSTFGKMLGRNIPTDWSTGLELDWTAGTWMNRGTVTLSNASTALTGVGTAFLTELVVGDRIQLFSDTGVLFTVVVAAITNNTAAVIRGFSPFTATGKAYTRFYTRFSDISFSLSNATGTVFSKDVRVQAVQGAFASVDLAEALDGIMHQPYFLGRNEAIMIRLHNHAPDARRVHGHVYTVRVLT